MSKALLAVAYVLLVVPVGLAVRVLHDPMRRTWRRHQPSYWQNEAEYVQ